MKDKNEYPKLVKRYSHYHGGVHISDSLTYEVEKDKFIHTTSGIMGCLTEHEREMGCIAFEVWPAWLSEKVKKIDNSGGTSNTI